DRCTRRGSGAEPLTQRGVEDALVPVLGPHGVGRSADSALSAAVLAPDHDPLVAFHLLVHGRTDRLKDVHLGHVSDPPRTRSGSRWPGPERVVAPARLGAPLPS